MATTTFDEQGPGIWLAKLTDIGWDTGTDLLPADSRSRRIDTLIICSSDTVDHDIGFYVNDGSANHHIGFVHVPLGAGVPSVSSVDALATLLPSGSNGITLPSGWLLGIAAYEAVSVDTKVELTAIGGYLS